MDNSVQRYAKMWTDLASDYRDGLIDEQDVVYRMMSIVYYKGNINPDSVKGLMTHIPVHPNPGKEEF